MTGSTARLALLCVAIAACSTRSPPSVERARQEPRPPAGVEALERSGDRYELGALPAELGEVRWPAAPRVSRDLTIDGDGGSRTIDRAGTRVLVRGALDRLVVAASDVEVRAEEGARIGQLTMERGVARVSVRGGRYGAIELPVPAQHVPPPPVWRRDWLVRDVRIEGVEVDAADTAFAVRGVRVAILNSRARAARYSVWCGDTQDFQTEDLVLAGNRFESAGPESTVRLVGVRRAIVVDNTLSNTFKHDFRVHGTSDQVVFARNRLLHTGIMVGSMPEDHIGSVWILDNEVHHDVPSLFQVGRDRVRRLVARGNRVYSDRWDCFVCEAPREGWEIGDNPVAPYRPFTPR